MLAVSKNTLKMVSGIVWFSGGAVLLAKGASLYVAAIALKPDDAWSWLAIASGVLIGAAKGQLLFSGFCRRNLARIAVLSDPRLWQAFRPGFYVFLAAMVLLGATLSGLAIGSYPALMAMVVLDISLGIALLGSLRVFWHAQDRRTLE